MTIPQQPPDIPGPEPREPELPQEPTMPGEVPPEVPIPNEPDWRSPDPGEGPVRLPGENPDVETEI